MSDTVSRDKAIAALSEINKLRHQWNEKEKELEDLKTKAQTERGVFLVETSREIVREMRVQLGDTLERAYEILNSD